MLGQVLRTIRTEALLQPGDRVLVGLSGGPDSTALLVALAQLAGRLDVQIEAACVNHGLRAEAEAEAAVVAERAHALGVRCAVLRVDVGAARASHVSLQDAARRVRLAALEEHATTVGATRVALGHTADDQAETLLFRIVRGTGVAGLSGIPYRRGPFIRPLLDVRRAELLRFLARKRIAFVEDPSNLDPRFARARIRARWLPALAAENPRVVDALLSLAHDARRVAAGRPRLTTQLRASRVADGLLRAGAGTKSLTVAGARIELSYGRARQVSSATAGAIASLPVSGPGLYRLSAASAAPALRIAVSDGNAAIAPAAVAFALDGLPPGELTVRAPRPGDRVRVRGGAGSRKLARLLVDAKVPRPLRASWPVLVCGDEVLYAPGVRPSELARPQPETRRLLVVSIETSTAPFIDQKGSADNTF